MKKFILILLVIFAVASFTSCVSYEQVKKEHAQANYYPVHTEWNLIIFYLAIGICGVLIMKETSPVIGGIMLAIALMAFYTNYSADGDYFVSWSHKSEIQEHKKDYEEQSLYDKIFWQ